MATKDYNFQYVPLTGRLPGNSFVKQTEQAINELAEIVNEGSAQVEVITNLANTANDNAEEALEKANEALETAGRVYITLPNLDDADSYFDSQLYYFANSYSHNLPVQGTGFLEVKTNDTKTACEQVFIADLTGLCYFRHGTITSAEVGSETVYSVTWDIWSSPLASEDYVQQEVNTGIGAANDYTDEQLALNVPVGCVQAYAGQTTPQGWLLCDGSAISRTQYNKLFGVIGTTYGAGDGTDTFNLPDLVDKFVEGSATSGTVKSAGLPDINGAVGNIPSYVLSGAFATSTSGGPGLAQGGYYSNGIMNFSAATGEVHNGTYSNLVYGKSDTVQPPALTMRYIIKY
jgi:microcystin-dependent protein